MDQVCEHLTCANVNLAFHVILKILSLLNRHYYTIYRFQHIKWSKHAALWPKIGTALKRVPKNVSSSF